MKSLKAVYPTFPENHTLDFPRVFDTVIDHGDFSILIKDTDVPYVIKDTYPTFPEGHEFVRDGDFDPEKYDVVIDYHSFTVQNYARFYFN